MPLKLSSKMACVEKKFYSRARESPMLACDRHQFLVRFSSIFFAAINGPPSFRFGIGNAAQESETFLHFGSQYAQTAPICIWVNSIACCPGRVALLLLESFSVKFLIEKSCTDICTTVSIYKHRVFFADI